MSQNELFNFWRSDNARSKFDLEVVSQNFVYLPKYSHNISFLSYCGKFQKGFLSLDVFLTLSKVKSGL